MTTEYAVFFSVDDDYSLMGRIRKFDNISPRNRKRIRITGAGYGAGRYQIEWQFKTEKPARALYNRMRRFRANGAQAYMTITDEAGIDFVG